MFSILKKMQKNKQRYCAAVVAAAGSSSRMGGVNKLLQPLDGVPVLVRTLTALERSERIREIVVATREEDLMLIGDLCKTYGISKCTKIICGGEDRVTSVRRALTELSRETELVAVQDGARPLVSPELIDRVVCAAERCGAAAPAIPVKDTIKEVGEDGAVCQTLQRDILRAVQTPQVFDVVLLKAALQAASEAGVVITDDCGAVERLGKVVYLIEGEETNLKITTPTDLIIAEAILRAGEKNI